MVPAHADPSHAADLPLTPGLAVFVSSWPRQVRFCLQRPCNCRTLARRSAYRRSATAPAGPHPLPPAGVRPVRGAWLLLRQNSDLSPGHPPGGHLSCLAAGSCTGYPGAGAGPDHSQQHPCSYLSPLLGELLQGCKKLHLTQPVLLAPGVPRFLDLAQPSGLSIWDAESCEEQIGRVLARCTSVRVLIYQDKLLPPHLPPNLAEVTVGENYPVSAAHFWRAVNSLMRLPTLAKLGITLQHDAAVVLGATDCFRCLSTLRIPCVSLESRPQ